MSFVFLTVVTVRLYDFILNALGGIALAAQAIPRISTYLSVAWSVCLSVVCHIRAPCLAGAYVGSDDTLC